MKSLFFTDLDDTLFQSMAKASQQGRAAESLIPVAFLENGEAHGYSTKSQRMFLNLIASGAEVIPTTARNMASYCRVRLSLDKVPNFAILNQGGTIVDSAGSPDKEWADQMAATMHPWLDSLTTLQGEISRWSVDNSLSAYARVIGDFDQPFYVLVKDRQKNQNLSLERLRADWLEQWVSDQPGLVLHQNDNNLTVQPIGLDKKFAVNFIIDRYRMECSDLLVIGAGDSRSDSGFLSMCDYAIIPKNSQLNSFQL